MKTESEKSIEQIALEDYVWKTGTKKFLKVSNITAFITGVITYVAFVIWGNCDIAFVLSILPAMIVVVTTLVFFMPFSGLYRGKKKTRKVISNLSQEEKKKITTDYLNSEIQRWKKDITYCENKTKLLQKSIQHHLNEIEKLELELKIFS